MSEWGWLILAGGFACLVVVLVGLFGVQASASSVPSRTAVVVAREGDTLWTLARRFCPREDPRAVVSRIAELNSLEGSSGVRMGQSLLVPTDGL